MNSQQKKINAVNITFFASVLISTAFSIVPIIVFIINLTKGTSYTLPFYTYIAEHPVVNILTGQGIIAVPLLIFIIATKQNYPKLVRLKKMKISNLLLSILLGLLIQPLLRFLNALSLVYTENAISDTVLGISNQVPFLVAVLLMCVLPGIFEESMFRGALFESYREANPWKAVILSGFLFGIMHGNLNQFTYAFILGVIFALIVEATDSILSTMIIHFFTNLTSVFTMYLLPKLYTIIKELITYLETNGDAASATQLQNIIGDTTLSAEEWMEANISAASSLTMSLSQVLLTYLPSAVIFSVLAFLVLKLIAKRTGTWNNFRVMYLGADEVVVEAEAKGPYDKEVELNVLPGNPTLRIMTVPLIAAIALSALSMFFVESLNYLPK
ncbi:MAG: CPBP family intramembrane metalloprotease [Lachnospiraceae bacterium]|nr:CPBP family intramembrane metalloprotease [Lachnospiraceae bacterium]